MGMARGSVKTRQFSMNGIDFEAFLRIYRKFLYIEIERQRNASGYEGLIHFFLLDEGKAVEHEIDGSVSERDYRAFMAFLDRYVVVDFFRCYRFQGKDASYRILVRKGVKLDANNDLGGFVYQNNKNSLLISPHRREVFERLQADLIGHEDSTAQLVRVGCLLKNEKFCSLHEQYFGKIGVASLNDGSTIKYRYADSIANNNVVTDMGLFGEYLDRVNTIPMSSFTQQNIMTQLVDSRQETKQVLMDNYSNFLFLDEDEIDFACIVLELFLHATDFSYSTENWVRAISYVKYLNGGTFMHRDDSELDYKRELGLYRARYILEHTSLPKLVHFLYDFFDFANLSRNIGSFYARINDLIGEDIREVFSHLETINVSLKSFQESKNPCEFFRYPQLVNFATAADKEIQKQVMGGEYNREFVAYYLCNYMQVADYKSYIDALPMVISIIRNLDVCTSADFNLFWMACDVLNEFWKCAPEDDDDLQDEIEKMIYSLFWARVGDVWPIAHRKKMEFKNEAEADAFRESLGWVMAVDEKMYAPKLRKYLKECSKQDSFDIDDFVDKKVYCKGFSKRKSRTMIDFLDGHDDAAWINAGVWCDDVSDEDIVAHYVFAANNGVYIGARRSALETWLLKGHGASRLLAIKELFINHFDDYMAFCKEVCDNDDETLALIFDTIAAMCESASNAGEDKIIGEFLQRVLAADRRFAAKYADKVEQPVLVDRVNEIVNFADDHIVFAVHVLEGS